MTRQWSSVTRKNITLCKIPTHIGIKGNEETDKAEKQATNMPEMTMTRLPHTEYYSTIRRARNSRLVKGMGKQY